MRGGHPTCLRQAQPGEPRCPHPCADGPERRGTPATEGRLFGTAVHTTFRICGRAHPDQILTSDVIRQLAEGKGFVFANRGRIALKGISGPVQLYEVQWKNEGA